MYFSLRFLLGILGCIFTAFSYWKCISNYVLLFGLYFLLRSLIGNVFLTTFIYCECISFYVLLLEMYFLLRSIIVNVFLTTLSY